MIKRFFELEQVHFLGISFSFNLYYLIPKCIYYLKRTILSHKVELKAFVEFPKSF